jgi:hypothetical protein
MVSVIGVIEVSTELVGGFGYISFVVMVWQ